MCGHTIRIRGQRTMGTVHPHDDFQYPIDPPHTAVDQGGYWIAHLVGGVIIPPFYAESGDHAWNYLVENYGTPSTIRRVEVSQ